MVGQLPRRRRRRAYPRCPGRAVHRLLEKPRLVTLGLNPGAADFGFQGRDGRFTRQVEADGYAAWARSDPYGSELWETHNEVNKPRRSGRRVNPHREARLHFARSWLSDESVAGRDLLMLELYPWHSKQWSGRYRPPDDVLQDFVWWPLAELQVDVVFAFARRWFDMAQDLGLTLQRELGPGDFTAKSRRAAVFALPYRGQRLGVVWQPPYAGPPGAEDARRLRELLAAE